MGGHTDVRYVTSLVARHMIHKARTHKNRIGEIYENDNLSAGLLSVDGQEFKGRLADRKVREDKWTAHQELRLAVLCESKPLDNVFKLEYLGGLFATDGQERFDIEARIVMATKGVLNSDIFLTPPT